MILNGVDPVLDYGPNVKLTLSAVGQLASPLQALWVFAAIAAKLDVMQFGASVQTPLAQLQAYRSWLIMRSKQVWPRQVDLISDAKLNALVAYWKPLANLSLDELIHSTMWQELWNGPVSIAAILDLIIKKSAETHALTSLPGPDPPQDAGQEDEDMPTPWMESVRVDPTCANPDVHCDASQVAVILPGEPPVIFTSTVGTTVDAFLHAHVSLIGAPVAGCVTLNGRPVDATHVLQPSQTLVVQVPPSDQDCDDAHAMQWESGPLPIMPDELAQNAIPQANVTDPLLRVKPTDLDPTEPTAPWTQLPEESKPVQPAVGVVPVAHHEVNPGVTQPYVGAAQSCLSVAPLLALADDQFVKLPVPHVRDPMQLWSLRNQCIQAIDREQVLSRQGNLLADDEIRFHLVQLQNEVTQFRNAHQATPRFVSIVDPLLASGWIRDDGPSCHQGAKEHPDVATGKADLMTVFQVDGH